MFMVSQVLAKKDQAGTRGVASVRLGTSVLEAARLMNDKHIGSLIVLDTQGGVAGIITERDFLRRVIAAERSPSSTVVDQVMTKDVLTCHPAARLDELRGVMRDKHIRHMPVVEEGELLGMISIGDLNYAESQTLSEQVEHLESYIRMA